MKPVAKIHATLSLRIEVHIIGSNQRKANDGDCRNRTTKPSHGQTELMSLASTSASSQFNRPSSYKPFFGVSHLLHGQAALPRTWQK
jgi:hypothetical protein